MRVRGVHHVAIKARDVEASAAFYRDVLGLVEIDRHLDAEGLRSIWLDTGDAVILMVERAGTSAVTLPEPSQRFHADPPAIHVLAFSIAATERGAWRARLIGAGRRIVHETPHTLYVFDPDGNRVGISCWPERPSEAEP